VFLADFAVLVSVTAIESRLLGHGGFSVRSVSVGRSAHQPSPQTLQLISSAPLFPLLSLALLKKYRIKSDAYERNFLWEIYFYMDPVIVVADAHRCSISQFWTGRNVFF
jgi:hypothetical protein